MSMLLVTITTETIRVLYALATIIATRWLMELATPQADIRWLKRQWWFQYLYRLKFYRGKEWFHQQNARRLLGW